MKSIPGDREGFTRELHNLLEQHGWYNNNGWRESSDRDRGHRPGLSEGEVVDELVRREWREYSNE
jgi:hypothetical protein